MIFVENGIDVFYIKIYNDKYKLYHQNKKSNKKCYHTQNKNFNSLEEVLKYCNRHKRQYFKTKYLRNLKKISNLLEIEKEKNNARRKKAKEAN